MIFESLMSSAFSFTDLLEKYFSMFYWVHTCMHEETPNFRPVQISSTKKNLCVEYMLYNRLTGDREVNKSYYCRGDVAKTVW